MKFLLLFSTACLTAFNIYAQGNILKPEFENVVYGIENSKLVKLEKTKAKSAAKQGFGKLALYLYLPGKEAKIRLKADSEIRFVVNISGTSELGSLFPLYKAELRKGQREA